MAGIFFKTFGRVRQFSPALDWSSLACKDSAPAASFPLSTKIQHVRFLARGLLQHVQTMKQVTDDGHFQVHERGYEILHGGHYEISPHTGSFLAKAPVMVGGFAAAALRWKWPRSALFRFSPFSGSSLILTAAHLLRTVHNNVSILTALHSSIIRTVLAI